VAAKSREQASDGAGGPFLDGGSAWQALRADPAFRSTDSGRSLLRMLSAYQTIEQQSQQLIDQVPVHCMSRVAVAAQACAQAWQHFAEHAERQSRAISDD
jgi:alpha-ketoglutarate-dependent taurine dioxygenase